MRTMPLVQGDSPRFSVTQATYDLHASSGKWSVHVDSRSSTGIWCGPQGMQGRLGFSGKVLTSVSNWLPDSVKLLLAEWGYSIDI